MDIKIYLAELRWYCAGVHRAIKILDKAIKQFPTPIYVNHEIIHNKFIINYYEKKWIIFGEKLKDIPENSIMIFSAHWVGPKFIKKLQNKNIKYIDASCPLVIKVHSEAKMFLKKWYDIIYIWKRGHQEAEWVKEEDKHRIHIIWNQEDLKNIKIDNEKIALLTQTTLSIDDTKILIEIVKSKFPNIELPKIKDICFATTNRQEAVKKICENNLDLLIIIGSQNSSNSNKLKQIWEKLNINSILIDSYKEIDITILKNIYKNKNSLTTENFSLSSLNIWISSWASAPDKLVKEVIEYLKSIWNTQIEIIKTVEEKMIFPSNL